jgi:hypothetical protein
MDNQLNSLVKIDESSDTVRIDVRGSLTQDSRPDLLHEIQRVRRMGVTSPITVDLSHAAFVESSALAGLRIDLNAQDAGAQRGSDTRGSETSAGVSLVLMAGKEQPVAESRPDFTALMYPEQLAESLEAAGVRPLSSYSSEELLAASDYVFELLDDPAGHAGNELLARYDAIGEELNRRELCKATEKQSAGS